jgi:RNA polymerase sigma factor (sigma-70 family)
VVVQTAAASVADEYEEHGQHDLADGFSMAIRRETPRLLAIAHSILDDAGAAEDAVQEALLLAWRSWDRLRDPARRQAWLVRICVRQSLRTRRHRLARLRVEAPVETDIAELPAHLTESPVDWPAAWRAFSPGQRAVLTLHYHHGYTLDECAAAMGCRPGTARRHLHRALEKLRREVEA